MGKLPNRDFCRDDVERAIYQWIIGPHAERNREIVSRKLFDGITFEQLAEEFDLSVRQAKAVVYKCYDVIFRHIPD